MTSRSSKRLRTLFGWQGIEQVDPEGQVIGWRVDPEESFSDWKIHVRTTPTGTAVEEGSAAAGDASEEDTTETYHVHKFFLAAGNRSSAYFRGLFQHAGNSRVREGVNHESTIVLGKSAASVFPAFLDFMYTTDDEISVEEKPHLAVSLRHLASYFQVPSLLQAVDVFIARELSSTNVHVFLQEALEYLDTEVTHKCMEIASGSSEELLQSTVAREGSPQQRTISPVRRAMTLLSQEQQCQVLQKALKDALDKVTTTQQELQQKDILLGAYRRRVRSDTRSEEVRRPFVRRNVSRERREAVDPLALLAAEGVRDRPVRLSRRRQQRRDLHREMVAAFRMDADGGGEVVNLGDDNPIVAQFPPAIARPAAEDAEPEEQDGDNNPGGAPYRRPRLQRGYGAPAAAVAAPEEQDM